ncbi:MAG TPA: tetratricopeptide repeat protein, partial [Spirochaetota bacterium]|nr:tetratricopeptide repeat protein [Spirochaetota bacterium]
GKENEAVKMEELAYDFFKEIEESDLEKSDSFYYYFGRFYLYRENYEKSTEYFEEFLDLTDNQERKSEVKELLSNIKNLGVTNKDYQMAQNLITSEKNSEAIEFVDKYITDFPSSYHGYYLKGICYKNLMDYEKAISFFERALTYNNNSSDIFNEIGICYMNLGTFYKAELNFTNALKNNPEDLAILYNFAILYYKKGDKKESLKYCNIILEFDPNDLHAKDLKKIIEES